MADEKNPGGLTAQEEAYFASQGEETPEVETVEIVDEIDEDAPSESEEQKADPAPKKRDVVPHGALHEEREKRKASEAREREAAVKLARLEERTNMILAQFQQPQRQPEQEAPLPDPEADIFEYVKRTGQSVQQVKAELEQRRQYEAQQARVMQLRAYSANSIAELATKVEDAREAISYLENSFIAERRRFGAPEHVIRDEIAQYEAQVADWAMQNGKTPAEVFYELAKDRGYSTKPKGKPEALEKIESVERGQAASRSMTGTGGQPSGSGSITAEDLLKMDENEFHKFAAKNPRKMRELMGG